MIGYEILTRQVVFEGAPVNLIVTLITESGQKSDIKLFTDVESCWEQPTDLEIFTSRRTSQKDIVENCWQTRPDDRPQISNVKEHLNDLAPKKAIYYKRTHAAVDKMIRKRKLKAELLLNKRLRETFATKVSRLILILAIMLTTPAFVGFVFRPNSDYKGNESIGSFLVLQWTSI